MGESNYRFLDDKPVIKDAIGHYKIIANQLYETIHCNLEKPFVIGLFGSWGSGKSSIIEMLKSRCKEEQLNKTKVIVVDAWRKEKEIFNRQFLKKIARELFGTDKHFNDVRKAVEEVTTINNSYWTPSLTAWILFSIFVLFFLVVTACAITGWYINRQVVNPFPYALLMGSVTAILIACYFQFLLPKFSIRTDANTKNVSIHDIDYFRQIYFDQIISRTEQTCIVIVIDNLDRVEAEEAISIMRTLKTFIVDAKEDEGTNENVEKDTLNKVVFLVPCCDSELRKHIKKTNAVDDASEFLHKIFNVNFRIPKFREQDAFQYARSLIETMGLDFDEAHKSTICHIISEGYGNNPRKAKIFLNNFLLTFNVAKACEEGGKLEAGIITIHPDWLAICMAEEELKNAESHYYFKELKKEIEPAFEIAIRYLKKPNYYELIPDFDILHKTACRNDEQFTKLIVPRADEASKIIDAIWNNINKNDTISRINTITSIMRATETNERITISPLVTDQMALCLSIEHPQKLPQMDGSFVYELILKGKTEYIINAIEHFGETFNGQRCSAIQSKYCIDLLEAVLEDKQNLINKSRPDQHIKFEQVISKSIEKLVASNDEMIPTALEYPEYPSAAILNKALNKFKEEEMRIDPETVFSYFRAVESTKDNKFLCFNDVLKSCNTVLNQYQDRNMWATGMCGSDGCLRILKVIQRLHEHAYTKGYNIAECANSLIIMRDMLKVVDDANKLVIIDIYNKTKKNANRYQQMNIGNLTETNSWNQWFLQNGTEDGVLLFIQKFNDSIKDSQFLATGAKRYKAVCREILDVFPSRRSEIIIAVWGEHSDWIVDWVKSKSSTLETEEKRIIQSALVGIATSKKHPIEIYEALAYLKIGNDKETKSMRDQLFNNLLKAYGLDTIEGLRAALERIGKAKYEVTDAQNTLLYNGWKLVSQSKVDKELRQLAEITIRMT